MAVRPDRLRRTRTSERSASLSWPRHILRAVWHWDFVVSLVIGVVGFVVMLTAPAPLVDIATFAIPAIPFGIAVTGFNWTAQRWVVDRTKESPIGRIVRFIDPTEMRLTIPYLIGMALGVITTIAGIAGLLVKYSLDRTGQAAFLSLLLFLVMYSLMATVSLIGVTIRHQRRYSMVQAEKEELERVQRELLLSKKRD